MKIENCTQFSIFVFRTKHSKLLTELPRREGERVRSHVNFSPQRLLRFPYCAGRIYLPLPLSLPRFTTLERRRREIRIYRVVTFPNMNDFSTEYIKDLVITQRKTHSEVSLLLKERFPGKEGPSSKSVRRFCLENGIHLHNRLSNDVFSMYATCMQHGGRTLRLMLRCFGGFSGLFSAAVI